MAMGGCATTQEGLAEVGESPGAAEVEASGAGADESTASQAISPSGDIKSSCTSACAGAAADAAWVVPSISVKPSAWVHNPVGVVLLTETLTAEF